MTQAPVRGLRGHIPPNGRPKPVVRAEPDPDPVREIGKMAIDPFDVGTQSAFKKATAAALAMLKAMPDTVDLRSLELALRRGGNTPTIVTHALKDIIERDMVPAVRSVYGRAGHDEMKNGHVIIRRSKDSMSALADRIGISLSFNVDNPFATRWASKFAGQLVTEVTKGQQRAIRALVLRALSEGGHPYQIAPEIRGMVGLTDRWATAVLNYRFALQKTALASDVVDARVARYYGSLLQTRAMTIARTEIMTAANAGRADAWQQAFSQGLFGTQEPTKAWSADGEGTCPECDALDGEEVLLSETFDTDSGGVDMPPAHPNCRCTAIIVQAEDALPAAGEGEAAAQGAFDIASALPTDIGGAEPALADQAAATAAADAADEEAAAAARTAWTQDFATATKYDPQVAERDLLQVSDHTGLSVDQIQQQIDDVSQALVQKAADEEEAVTAYLKKTVDAVNGQLFGLDFNLKTLDSMRGKLLRDAIEELEKTGTTSTPEQIGAKIGDALRYTVGVEEDQYTAAVRDLKETFSGDFDKAAWKNTWDTLGYRGINSNFLTADGYRFEIQFHTPFSFQLKEGELHRLYEVWRVTPTGSEDWIRLKDEMAALAQTIPIPEGAPEL